MTAPTTSLTYPSGREVTYSFDSAGRVLGLSMTAPGEASQTVFGNIAYTGLGALKSAIFVNGLTHTRSYDTSGRMTMLASGAAAQSLSFGYDDRANITSITDNLNATRSQSFGYDALSRLTSASGAYGAYAYQYDAVGNRTRRDATGVGAFNELLTYASASPCPAD